MPARTPDNVIALIVAGRNAGKRQRDVAAELGMKPGALAVLCMRRGITGWPIGAAARDQSGVFNPNWQGGDSRATIARTTKKVLTASGKDLFTCERCGDKRDVEQPRHHKDRNRKNNKPSNLEVLCCACHNKEHMPERNRDRLGRFYGT